MTFGRQGARAISISLARADARYVQRSSVYDDDARDLAILDDFARSTLGEIADPFRVGAEREVLMAREAEVRARVARTATTARGLAGERNPRHLRPRQRWRRAVKEARER